MKPTVLPRLLGAVLVLLWAAAPPSAAQTDTIRLNQKRMRIEQLVQRVAEAVDRTVLVPDDVRGTISIVSKRPVDLDEAWSMLDTSLSILGYSLLPSTGGTWRIAKVADAVGEAPFRPAPDPEVSSYVTTLIPLRAAALDDVVKVLEPLAGTRVTLVPYPATNSLIASGSERAIARLTTLADELDRVDERTLRLRVLRYRDVSEVEPLVEAYLEREGSAARGLQIWSDVRTNSLLVRGDDEGVARVIGFVERVDQPIEGEGVLRILRVLHRDPEEVAEIVRSLAGAGPPAAAASAVAGGGGVTPASATTLDQSDFTIAVDAPSRSLVVRASPEAHVAIRELVETLDELPQQVAVDLTISRITTPSDFALSFEVLDGFALGNDGSDLVGIFQNQPFGVIDQLQAFDPDSPQPIEIGGLTSQPTLFGAIQRDTGVTFIDPTTGEVRAFDATSAIVAADTDFRSEILIQPSLVVTSGEDHEIFVGTDVPIPVQDESPLEGVEGGTLGLSSLARTTTFERTEIGTRVALSARVGKEGKIELDLDIELSAIDLRRASLAGDPFDVGPSFVKQTLDVTARLDDGETAVLSVDKRQIETQTSSGVPFMRDIPFLGTFFRGDALVIRDSRLVVAVRARRLSSPAELVADTIRRRIAFERASAREATLPEVQGSPYGVRVTTRLREDDAEAIAESLSLRGFRTRTHRWQVGGSDRFDVYVIALDTLVDAADIAALLSEEGWETDLVVLAVESES